MKIIGMQGEQYIAVISHTEMEKLTDNYYGKLPKLKVGDDFDLGAGYDFRSDIRNACSSAVDAMKRYESAQGSLFKFAMMVTALPEPEKNQEVA
jgi:hypothetical protein